MKYFLQFAYQIKFLLFIICKYHLSLNVTGDISSYGAIWGQILQYNKGSAIGNMTRPLRIEFKGAVYYLTYRGNPQQAIFLDEKDFADFLRVLGLAVKRYHFLLPAYCLMNNHDHLLIETPYGNLSRGMRQLNGLYTQRFNQRRKQVGHLLQGRYQAILVDKGHYLLTLCRYVVLNPVMANIVKDPADLKWSTYRATTGYDQGIPGLTTDWILSQFGKE